MRVGVYVDGYNLYYGGRAWCGRGTAGWRWLDVRQLAQSVMDRDGSWPGAHVERLVYCTARVDARTNPGGQLDQDAYLKALVASGSVDYIEYGRYAARVKSAPLAVKDVRGRPSVVTSNWPVMIQDAASSPVINASYIVSVLNIEEKGSDVNVASHMLIDTLRAAVDAVVLVSNDSDLRYPIQETRTIAHVGVINPTRRQLAGDLHGDSNAGVGRHWSARLSAADFRACQLPERVGAYRRPHGW